jgi:putative ABC transport system permease protein
MSKILVFWRGQLRSKGIQYVLLVLLTILVSIGFYAAKITESYIFKKWTESAQYTDVIVGYKGSPLQIVASTLFRLENPTGNIDSTTVDFWQKHPLVASSCPVSMGDNINGYPLIGTSEAYYNWMNITLVDGTFPETDEDVVVSVALAKELGLKIGSHLHSSHGSETTGESHDHHHLNIVGLIHAERTADEKAFFTTTGAYYGMHEGKGQGEVTALMLRLKSKSALVMLPRLFEKRNNEQGAFPVFIFAQLQKQWTPTLEKMKKYSIAIPTVLLLMFIFILSYLSGTERPARAFLRLQKHSRLHVFIMSQGLSVIAVFIGALFSIVLLGPFEGFYVHQEEGIVFIPLLLTALVGVIQSRRS